MNDPNRTQLLTNDPNRTQLGAPPTVDPNRTVMSSAPSINVTQTIKPVQCPVCKTFNPAGVFYCIDCGLIFEKSLPDDAFGAPAVQLPTLVDQNGREYPVRPGLNAVGREGDVMLSDPRASRRHAQITSDNGVLSIEDLGSTNGTKVDGAALTPNQKLTLKGGERISFGGIEMQLTLPGEKGGNATQVFGSNKTAAIATPPQKEVAPATLVGEGRELPLRAGANTFGRKSDNDIQVSDPYVSGKHGIIEVADDGIFITDIGSSNGTMLNDAKLVPNMRTQLTPEDVIRLGSKEFQVRVTPPKAG